MKSLILALILFGVVVYGCFDVKPYRAAKRLIRRNTTTRTGPLRATGPLVRDNRGLRVDDDKRAYARKR